MIVSMAGHDDLEPLPTDPPGWADRDREFAEARLARRTAARLWREAGGYWPVRGEPSHPELWAEEWAKVVEATNRVYELAREATTSQVFLPAMDILDEEAIESAVGWLVSDPFCVHSGYLKQKVMCRLCWVPITSSQEERIRDLLLRLTIRGPRQDFRDACRLARRVDTPEFRNRLRGLSQRPEPHISYAAGRMLAACESKGRH